MLSHLLSEARTKSARGFPLPGGPSCPLAGTGLADCPLAQWEAPLDCPSQTPSVACRAAPWHEELQSVLLWGLLLLVQPQECQR